MNRVSGKLPITVIIAAKNEEVNIGKCIHSLQPVQRVVLLDSNSTDNTAAIAQRQGADVVQFAYTGGYPKKRQWALDHVPIDSNWVFLLDADEVVPEALWQEIAAAFGRPGIENINAFAITKGFHFLGKRLKYGGFSHKAVLLFRKGEARFEHILDDPADFQDMEVHERLLVRGKTAILNTPLVHEDFKSLTAYIDRHNKYSTWEAAVRYSYLENRRYGQETITPNLFGNVQERRRFLKKIAVAIPFEPACWFLYHYILRLGFLEGKRGLIAAQIRYGYIAQVRAKIFEHQLRKGQVALEEKPLVFTTESSL